MDRVIVERPRLGSSLPARKKGYRRHVQSLHLDEAPRRGKRMPPRLRRWSR